MQIKDLKPGERFWFRGDWQTAPSVWRIIKLDNFWNMFECESEGPGEPSGQTSLFFGNVTVEKR